MVETEKLEGALRNTFLYLAVYEILLLIFGIVVIGVWLPAAAAQPELPIFLLIVLVGLGLLGLVLLPVRGRFMEAAYTNRMLGLQARYIETVNRGADKQVAYGMQLRRDAIAPLTRLVEAQTDIQTQQLNRLQAAQQEMVGIESALTTLGRRSLIPGLRG